MSEVFIIKLYEYEGKRIFQKNGIQVPVGIFMGESLTAPDVSVPDMSALKFPCMVKAQILQGGRGKAGGIKKAADYDDAIMIARGLMSKSLKDEELHGVLFEEMVDIDKELYVGITIDDVKAKPLIILSEEGGMEIEKVAQEEPEKLVKEYLDVDKPMKRHEAITLCKKIGLTGRVLVGVADTIVKLYETFIQMDAVLVEINPLIITKQGDIIAGDAKIVTDDYALYRHPELSKRENVKIDEDEYERRARENNYILIRLGGEIAVISGGAGYGMGILDAISICGGTAANFLDIVGGQALKEAVKGVVDMARNDHKVKSIVFSFILSATSLGPFVDALFEAISERPLDIPVFASLRASSAALRDMDMETAVAKLTGVGVKMYDDLRMAVKEAVKCGEECRA